MTVNSLPNLDAYWMPFTANRQFKQAPRLHTYLKPGTYEVTTTLTWSVRYEANIIGLPITGALPDETTRSTRSITITELTTRLIPN